MHVNSVIFDRHECATLLGWSWCYHLARMLGFVFVTVGYG